jgi:spore coat protein JB
LQHINEVSFAVNDVTLYLDSHPCDNKAMEFYKENVKKRNKALREYAKHYGPLTIDTADDAQSNSWEWISQPWPWEGGNC